MSIEAGGLNSIMPIYVAARLRIPMVDCDGMGRAFPEIQMTIFTAHGITASPFAMSDERGNVLLMDTVSNHWVETFARSCVVHMGAEGMIALYSATVKQLKEAAIHGTITLAEEIGKTVRNARREEANPVDAVRRRSAVFSSFAARSPMSTGASKAAGIAAMPRWPAPAISAGKSYCSSFRMSIWLCASMANSPPPCPI